MYISKNLKSQILGACAIFITAAAADATVTLNLSAGDLFEANGTTVMPDGGLIQLLVSSDGSFAAPTASSFTGGASDEEVLASDVMNSASYSGEPGLYEDSFTFTIGATPSGGSFATAASDLIELRWYPTLTSSATTPGGGTTYGQFRTSSEPDGSDSAWVLPASGTIDLTFLTASEGGSQPNSAGAASNTVAAAPEPSSLAFCAVGLAGAVGMIRRRIKK